MLITPDFSEATESGSIADGVYKARVVSCEPRTSKAGNQYLNWKLTIFGAEGEASRFNNWSVFHNTMVTGKGAGMLRDLYRAAMHTDPTGAFDSDALLGKEIEITVATGVNPETGEKKRFPDVKAVKKISI